MADLLTDAEFEKFRKAIYDESGITFSAANRPILSSRIAEAVRKRNLGSVEDYYNLVTHNKEEMKFLLDSVTTNLTHFFRTKPHLEALVHYVLPRILAYKKKIGDTNIKVWSAGCSTGEEPYTLAMILKEALKAPFTFSVTASDISLKSLMVGRQGFYTDSRVEGVPLEYLRKYFTKTTGGYQISRELMNVVRFDYHNLMHSSVVVNFDIVFCRNVLIYFDVPAQTTVVQHFWDAMCPYSFLFIGHSESLFGMKTQFKFLNTEWATFYQKGDG